MSALISADIVFYNSVDRLTVDGTYWAGLQGKAQPQFDEPEVGRVVEPARHATVPRAAAPTTAPGHAVRAGSRASGVGLRGAAVIAFPVIAPLPHVAAHVIDVQLVGLLGSHIMGFIASVELAEVARYGRHGTPVPDRADEVYSPSFNYFCYYTFLQQ